MSTPESVPAGTVSLEDDGPASPPVPEPAPPAQAAAPEPPPDPAAAEDAELARLDPNGLLAALKAERKEKQALRARAGQADQLEQWVNQARPYIDLMQKNGGLIQQQAPAPQPAAPAVDPELRELAETLSLYTPAGELDIDKAAKVAQFTERRAKRESQQAIEPWARSSAEQQSARNYHTVVNSAAANGVKPDPTVLSSIWRQLPANLTADPQVATLVQLMATGAAAMAQPRAVAPQQHAPLVTEGAGGHPNTRPLLSQTERNVAAARGITETTFADLGKGFKQGRPSSLED